MSVRARSAAAVGALALSAALVVAAPSYATGDPTICLSRTVTIPGTPDDDVVVGSFGSDVIATYDGGDVVRGEADFGGAGVGDADYICLGKGDDVADGAVGQDVILGGPGNDVIQGSSGAPTTVDDEDNLRGGPGNDVLSGYADADVIKGDQGNDQIDLPGAGGGLPPNAGPDKVRAGAGDDEIDEQGDGAVDVIDAGSGNDKCTVDVTDVVKNCETVIRVP